MDIGPQAPIIRYGSEKYNSIKTLWLATSPYTLKPKSGTLFRRYIGAVTGTSIAMFSTVALVLQVATLVEGGSYAQATDAARAAQDMCRAHLKPLADALKCVSRVSAAGRFD